MKKLVCIALTVLSVQVVNAAYLYWQVNTDTLESAADATSWYTDGSVNVAKVYGSSDGSSWSSQTIYLNGSETAKAGGEWYATVPSASAYQVNVDVADLSTSTYTYYIELGNYSNSSYTPVARGEQTMVKDLYSSTGTGSITTSLSDIATISLWHGGTYSAVPEPTSAILMLFGAAFLGLKRKNRSLA